MIQEQITCDSCGSTTDLRNAPSGWISIENLSSGFGLAVSKEIYRASSFSHYCGIKCAMKFLRAFLEAKA